MDDRSNYTAAKELLAKSRRILISGHLSPDGDSLGSMIALARMLTAAGHEAFATADVHDAREAGKKIK
jgi:nanoRNase/pAp phosphatase (c-di-AMP/oligoRNAs hydrolase)